MQVSFAARTDMGRQRTNNEDNYYVLADQHLYVVADGMGGHASGEVASLLAIRTLGNYYVDGQGAPVGELAFPMPAQFSSDETRLSTAIRMANRAIYEAAQSDDYRGMGTTLVALQLGAQGAHIAHVGDSRAYRITDGEIVQLTEDHSLINEYMRIHGLSKQDVVGFAHKNVIVRALGLADDVTVDFVRLNPKTGETYLLCSDGLTDMLTDEQILATLKKNKGNVEKGAQALVDAANQAGGQDNITVVLVRLTP